MKSLQVGRKWGVLIEWVWQKTVTYEGEYMCILWVVYVPGKSGCTQSPDRYSFQGRWTTQSQLQDYLKKNEMQFTNNGLVYT